MRGLFNRPGGFRSDNHLFELKAEILELGKTQLAYYNATDLQVISFQKPPA